MDFTYSNLSSQPSAAFPQRSVMKRPTLKIKLEKNGRRIVVWALVDSGADCCIFPASMAKALGIAIPNSRASSFSGTAEASQVAYFETVQATIWNGKADEDPISFELYAGFCNTMEHVGLGLLGQEGFFSRFAVLFDFSSNLLRIT